MFDKGGNQETRRAVRRVLFAATAALAAITPFLLAKPAPVAPVVRSAAPEAFPATPIEERATEAEPRERADDESRAVGPSASAGGPRGT